MGFSTLLTIIQGALDKVGWENYNFKGSLVWLSGSKCIDVRAWMRYLGNLAMAYGSGMLMAWGDLRRVLESKRCVGWCNATRVWNGEVEWCWWMDGWMKACDFFVRETPSSWNYFPNFYPQERL